MNFLSSQRMKDLILNYTLFQMRAFLIILHIFLSTLVLPISLEGDTLFRAVVCFYSTD